MKRLVHRDNLLYVAIIVLIIVLGQMPIIARIFHTPEGRYYPLLDKIFYTDYAYVAAMRFAMEGSEWMQKNAHVWADHQPSLMWFVYVVLGKIAKVSGFGPFEVFALFRVVGGILFLTAAAALLRLLLPKKQSLIAFALFAFAQPFPFWNNGNLMAQDINHFVWDIGEAARRVSSLPPHYSLGKGLMLVSLAAGFLAMRRQRGRLLWTVIAAGAVIAAGFIYPMPVFLLLFIFSVSLGAYFLVQKGNMRSLWNQRFFVFLPILAAGLIPLIVLKLDVAAKGFPWTLWNTAELGYNTAAMQFELRYLQMLGPLLLLVPFGVWKLLRQSTWSFSNLFVLVWFLSPFLLFPFANALSFGKHRFIESIPILPAAVLAVWGWQKLAKASARMSAFLVGGFLGYFLLFSSLVTYASTVRLWPAYDNVYVPRIKLAALDFLRTSAEKDTVVLANVYPSNYIPAFARVRTIVGNPVTYSNDEIYWKELNSIAAIFKGQLPKEEAQEFLSAHLVRYVYDDAPTTRHLYPQFLEKIYDHGTIVIYRVR